MPTELVCTGSGETLKEFPQRCGGCPAPGRVQGQVGWGCEQPGTVEIVPA